MATSRNMQEPDMANYIYVSTICASVGTETVIIHNAQREYEIDESQSVSVPSGFIVALLVVYSTENFKSSGNNASPSFTPCRKGNPRGMFI
jgi:hypothetical protein